MSDLDDTALALEALAEVCRVVQQAVRAKHPRGTGTIICPKCKELKRAGMITYTFEHRRTGSRPTSYVAWCSTHDCIKFSGH